METTEAACSSEELCRLKEGEEEEEEEEKEDVDNS